MAYKELMKFIEITPGVFKGFRSLMLSKRTMSIELLRMDMGEGDRCEVEEVALEEKRLFRTMQPFFCVVLGLFDPSC